MKSALLDFLVCPSCKQSLSLDINHRDGSEIIEGTLTCSSCEGLWRIERGIPRIIPARLADQVKQNVNAFGNEWTHLGELVDKNEQEFLSYLQPLTKAVFTNRIVLDAGCGMGKFTYLVGNECAAPVIGVDLSHAVEVAYQNTKHLPNVHIVQADIYNLPLKADFDFIYSIGVLHHLPASKRAFLKLSELLKTGGTIFAWVYGREGNGLYIYLADPIREWITSQLPFRINVILAHMITICLWCFTTVVYYPIDNISIFKPISRYLPYFEYLLYFKKIGYRLFAGTVLDKMIPTISHYFTYDEFKQWFHEARLSEVKISQRNGNSWRGYGRNL